MKKHSGLFCVFLFVFFSVVFAEGIDDFVIKSSLFRSTEQEISGESDVVVSLFSVPVLIPYHPSYVQLEKINIYRLKTDLQKIYKIENIDHLASGLLLWDGKKSQLDGIIIVKESSYPLMFYPSMLPEGNFNLRVQVSQPRDSSGHEIREEHMLDTEMVMRADSPYVLGFPSEGNRYFLSISIASRESGKYQQDEYAQTGPDQDIPQTPLPVQKIIPTYPPQLKQENVGGKVILQVSINKQGSVTEAKILHSAHPELDEAAVSAIEQWTFAPILKKNKPITASFPIMVEFRPTGKSSAEADKNGK
jgi:TonB family protein